VTPDAASAFEPARKRLLSIAYRMLGSVSEAEDVVQDAYLKWHEADRAAIDTPAAWLTTVVTRLAIDRLRKLKLERESYPGPWLPEPWIEDEPSSEEAVSLASDLSYGFMLMLERLAPQERAALVLHEAFECGYEEIAAILGKTPDNCRQIVSRARERVKSGKPKRRADAATARRVLESFVDAIRSSDKEKLLAMLASDAVLVGDGGGKAKAALKPVEGGERIATFISGLAAPLRGRITGDLVAVNGQWGVVLKVDGAMVAVMSAQIDDGRIGALYNVVNPDKLQNVKRALDASSRARERA
jgi:RNA polymerase sigma-70 factor (ECF subfamily)